MGEVDINRDHSAPEMEVLNRERMAGWDARGGRWQEITPEQTSAEAMPGTNIRPARAENRDDDLPSWLLLRDSAMDEGAIRCLQQHRTLRRATKNLPVPPNRHDERH
jgi:hypothetical protein